LEKFVMSKTTTAHWRGVTALTTQEPQPAEVAADLETVDVEVIVPAWNEEARLEKTLRSLTQHLARQPWSSAVVVVDNGCVDRTADVVRAVAADSPVPVQLLGCVEPGKGAAIRRGVLRSRATVIGFQDADLATPLDALAPAIRALTDGADIVVASRRCPGGRIQDPQPALRRLGGDMFHYLTGKVVPGIHDTQCGFKFLRGDVARALFAELATDGFAFDVELLARAQARGLRIAEIPVTWVSQDGSTFRMSRDGRRAYLDLFRLWRSVLAKEFGTGGAHLERA
jgi:dolichyl-phosphate beta-glucosyltransferase